MEQEEEEEESVQYELPTTDYAQLMQLLINRHVREHGDKPLGEAALSNLLRFARQKRDVDNAKEVEAALVALRNGTQDMAEFRGRVMLAGNGGLIWHQYADEAWIEAMRKGALAARRLPAQ